MHARLTSFVEKPHCHNVFNTHIAFGFPHESEHQKIVRIHFTKDAVLPQIAAIDL